MSLLGADRRGGLLCCHARDGSLRRIRIIVVCTYAARACTQTANTAVRVSVWTQTPPLQRDVAHLPHRPALRGGPLAPRAQWAPRAPPQGGVGMRAAGRHPPLGTAWTPRRAPGTPWRRGTQRRPGGRCGSRLHRGRGVTRRTPTQSIATGGEPHHSRGQAQLQAPCPPQAQRGRRWRREACAGAAWPQPHPCPRGLLAETVQTRAGKGTLRLRHPSRSPADSGIVAQSCDCAWTRTRGWGEGQR